MHNLLAPGVKEEAVAPGAPIYSLVDLCDVVEKLSAAAVVIFGAESPGSVQRWKMKLLNAHGAVWQVLAELHASGKETSVKDCPLHDAIAYLTNNGQMHELRRGS